MPCLYEASPKPGSFKWPLRDKWLEDFHESCYPEPLLCEAIATGSIGRPRHYYNYYHPINRNALLHRMSRSLTKNNKTQDHLTQINGHVGSVVIFYLQGQLQLGSQMRSILFQLAKSLLGKDVEETFTVDRSCPCRHPTRPRPTCRPDRRRLTQQGQSGPRVS